jgi:RHS repeat-associated protein
MDGDGTMVWWADYEAFGKPKGVGGPDSGAVDEVPRFTGKVWDEKIGLYYFNARWYDPKFGRFVSEDPVTIKELIEEQLSSAGQISKNANLYHYCYSNPLNLIDASGEHPKDASSVLLKYRLMKDPYHDTTGKKIAIWGVKFLFSLVCPVFGAVCVIEELVIILDETDYKHIVDYEDRLKFLHEAEDTMKANEKRINEIKAILAGGGLSKEEVDKLTDELTALTIDNERLAKEIEINREYDQKEKEEIESFNGYVVHGEKLFYVDERSSDYQE